MRTTGSDYAVRLSLNVSRLCLRSSACAVLRIDDIAGLGIYLAGERETDYRTDRYLTLLSDVLINR